MLIKEKLLTSVFFLWLSLLLSSCTPHPSKHESLHAVLWIQSSAEHSASAHQAYRVAKEKLDIALRHSTWTAALEQGEQYSMLPPAVIIDIDETILDNSPFQAQLVKDGKCFNKEIWKRWVQKAEASAIPGSLQFVTYAQSKGVEIFYVTNRTSDLEGDTRRNLEKIGFHIKSKPDTLLMKKERGWSSDKTSRRKYVAKDYRILLLIGDDLNDFISSTERTQTTTETHKYILEKYASYWGDKWILLPNPVYGSWERSLCGSIEGLTYNKRLIKKCEKLKTFE